MKLTFRQGIARYQTDAYGVPIFLQKSSSSGEFINVVVSPDPTVIVFAHRSGTYVVEEVRSVSQAWGPFSGGATAYLYWDINLLDAALTRGFTLLPPIYSGTEPPSPQTDQHWFNTTDCFMQVWNGRKWVEKVRVFAGTYASQATLIPNAIGTQAGLMGNFDGGNIILDSYNKPLRQADGSFVTSTTALTVINAGSKKVKFEAELLMSMAAENIPKFSLVTQQSGRRMLLARSTDNSTRISGIVTEDLDTSEVGVITTDGLVQYEQWSWPSDSVGRPVFCGATGQVTLTPPVIGVLQVVGYVYDTDSIYLNIQKPIILDNLPYVVPTPPSPPVLVPVADFYAVPTYGQAPLTVNFASASLNSPTSVEWDFTNNGSVDASTNDAVYTFNTPGVYSVRLRASNTHGQDDEIKTDYITVTAAPTTGKLTNLNINFSGPLQSKFNEVFTVTANISNAGAASATSVVRTISIDDVGSTAVIVTGLPVGSTSIHSNNKTTITLPTISVLGSGQHSSVSFAVQSPSHAGTITINGTVRSPEVDSTVGDNSATLTVRVKP